MRNLLILLLLIPILGFGQKKDKKIYAKEVLETGGVLVIEGDTLYLDSPTNGQFIRRVDGKWVNVDFTSAGTDSLVFDPVYGDLHDYRGGSVFKTTRIRYENFILENGGTRIITVRYADGGQAGDDLIVKAGDNDDNLDGGDLYLRGGGTFESFGDVYIGSSLYPETNSSQIYILDTLIMGGNKIKGLPIATESDQPVILSQIEGLTNNVYSIALPYATTVQGRINGAVQGTDYPSDWTLSVASNQIDLIVTHNYGRRVANVNVYTVSGTTEQLLRPFAGAYSGYQTPNSNQLAINSLATTPLALKIYIIFE